MGAHLYSLFAFNLVLLKLLHIYSSFWNRKLFQFIKYNNEFRETILWFLLDLLCFTTRSPIIQLKYLVPTCYVMHSSFLLQSYHYMPWKEPSSTKLGTINKVHNTSGSVSHLWYPISITYLLSLALCPGTVCAPQPATVMVIERYKPLPAQKSSPLCCWFFM